MSTASISINSTSSLSSRRHPVQIKSAPQNDVVLPTPPQPTPLPNVSNTLRDPSVETVSRRVGQRAVKIPKPKWYGVLRFFTNLLLLLALWGLIGIVISVTYKGDTVTSREITVISAELDDKLVTMNDFVKKSTSMMQVQVDAIDRKLEKEMGSVREQLEMRESRFEDRLWEMREVLRKEIGGRVDNLLSREEFEEFVEYYLKRKEMEREEHNNRVSLEDVRIYAKEVVDREIEKHASDGIGRVDFALGSGGASVVRHSEPYVGYVGRVTGWLSSILQSNNVHPNAKKMLTPSFGEPGMCFPLKGSSGYVIIRLRTAVVPEAITLEHVAKSVAYDRSSAPKDCQVSGWRAQAEDSTDLTVENEKIFLLSKFTYDLDKNNIQTFNVLDSVGSRMVDTIMFDFASNHGSSPHTCIYRLRIHGYEQTIES